MPAESLGILILSLISYGLRCISALTIKSQHNKPSRAGRAYGAARADRTYGATGSAGPVGPAGPQRPQFFYLKGKRLGVQGDSISSLFNNGDNALIVVQRREYCAPSRSTGKMRSHILLPLLNYCEYFPLPMIGDICVFQ
jgi:hypothetical protein